MGNVEIGNPSPRSQELLSAVVLGTTVRTVRRDAVIGQLI